MAELLELRDGDLIEIEQWGGWLDADACPPICGMWGNVWHGTGVAMRVSAPRTSLNKGTAIVEMIQAVGARDASVLPTLAAAFGLSGQARQLREAHPTAAAADVLATAVLSRNPCGGTTDSHRFAEVVDGWLRLAKTAPPAEVVRRFLGLGGGGGAAGGGAAGGGAADDEAARYGLFWLWGACGIGPLRWDRLLATLACVLGHGTVVLAASSNDNGLLHQEFVDFELPPHLGWPRGDLDVAATAAATAAGAAGAAGSGRGASSRRLNDVSRCVDPFGWVQRDRHAGPAAEARRRERLLAFWGRVRKFRLPAAVPDGAPLVRAAQPAAARSLPCAVAFGGACADGGGEVNGGEASGGEALPRRGCEGRVAACSYSFPNGTSTAEGAHKDCWAWCEGTLSATNANVSLLHSRVPPPRAA